MLLASFGEEKWIDSTVTIFSEAQLLYRFASHNDAQCHYCNLTRLLYLKETIAD